MGGEEYTRLEWRGYRPEPVIGVDEVGRGCLAGRVYAAAVIFRDDDIPDDYTDSKLLSEKRREKIAKHILSHHHVCIAFASVAEVDRLNIFQASMLAMKRAIEGLEVTSGHVLVDGSHRIPNLPSSFQQTTVVKGDLRLAPIGAASIVAKVERDQYMVELHEKFPVYGFNQHKGYSTPIHKQAIETYGPCREHRSTFAGVKEFLGLRRPEQGSLL